MQRAGLDSGILSFITQAAKARGLGAVVLFGSRARGDHRERSDIDLALQGGDIRGFEGDVEEGCPTLLSFDLVELDGRISPELKDRIDREGVVLYGQVRQL